MTQDPLKPNTDYFQELITELIGDENPFDFIQKRDYNFLAIKENFKNSDLPALKNKLNTLLSSSARDWVIQIRTKPAMNESLCKALIELRSRIISAGREAILYPSADTLPAELHSWACPSMKAALHALGINARGNLDSEVVETFCQSGRISFEVQAKTKIKFRRAEKRQESSTAGFFSGMIELVGDDFNGMAILSLRESSIRKLSEKMTGTPAIPGDPRVWNVAAEFINIITGHAKSRLNELGYEIAVSGIPLLLTPEFQQLLENPDGSNGVLIHLESELGPMILELRFYD